MRSGHTITMLQSAALLILIAALNPVVAFAADQADGNSSATGAAEIPAGDTGPGTWDKTVEVSSGVWDATKEGSAKAWDKTVEVSTGAWDATKEASAKAWDRTRKLAHAGEQETGEATQADPRVPQP